MLNTLTPKLLFLIPSKEHQINSKSTTFLSTLNPQKTLKQPKDNTSFITIFIKQKIKLTL